jgi:hypothetical protein
VRREGFEVGLDAGSSTAIRSCNGEHFFHGITSLQKNKVPAGKGKHHLIK